MKKILITGANGLVGTALTAHCIQNGDEVVVCDRARLDVSDFRQVKTTIGAMCPDVVINCAAWTDVDGCERDVERCERVNAIGPENLARACRDSESLLITISTDYVFDGTKSGFYTQHDNPNPQSFYARSKLEGERRAQIELARTMVVRTGFIFGSGGKNFLSTLVDRLRRGERVKAISDSLGTPTYAKHLATRLRELADLDLPGVFHVVNSGEGATYAEFAREAISLIGCDDSNLEMVSVDSLERAAPRPRNSRLKCLLSEALGLTPLPSWHDGLAQFIREPGQKAIQTRDLGTR